MAQYGVPQFVEVEDKIIGPLTLRQFIILLVTAGLIFFLFNIISNLFLFILAVLPIGGLGIVLAFSRFNGRPIGSILFYSLNFVSEPRSFIFNKQIETLPQVSRPPQQPKAASTTVAPAADRLSRLHKLTYILDQDVKEEEALIKQRYLHLP